MKILIKLLFFFAIFFYRNSNATNIYIFIPDSSIKSLRIEQAIKRELTTNGFMKTAKQSANTKFFISLNEKEPLYALFILNDSLYTEPFYLDMAAARIDITINKDLKLEIRNSMTQDEYLTSYVPALQEINEEISTFFRGEYRDYYMKYNGKIPDSVNNRFDSIRYKMREKRFVAIYNYIAGHPDSYVAMWELLLEVLTYGYKEKLEEAYKRFSDKLKKSGVGNIVYIELQQALALEPGRQFPKFLVSDLNLKSIELKEHFHGKYILIDFWYSKCYPCIDQFETLKNLHNSYTRDKFEIISVSIDTKKDIKNWKQAIEKYDLPFAQYIDVNGTETFSNLNITDFPNNFLLDSTGKILARKITLNQLTEFLQAKLR